MVAMAATTVDVIKAGPPGVLEVMGIVTVKGVIPTLVPKSAIISPIAIHKRAVISVIVAVVIVVARPTSHHADTIGASATG
jgi:hypothetical protein